MKLNQTPLSDEIPTSSLADVAFLLVVFFLVAWTFSASRGLDLALPAEEAEPDAIDPVESVLVEIQADASLLVDATPMQLNDLLDYLQPILAQNPAKPVIVRPAPGARYGPAVDVLDELRAGRRKLGLARDIQIALPTQREIRLYWPS